MSTFFLFARPGFIEGMARVLDLGGTLNEYNRFLSPEAADAVALRQDWEAVGLDLMAAVEQEKKRLGL